MDQEFHYLALTCRELEVLMFAILGEAGRMAVESIRAGRDSKKQKAITEKIAVLKELSQKKKDAVNNTEKRLYNVLFTIVREELDTVHKFISKR